MKDFIRDENGSILTEYGLLVVIVAVGLILVLGAFRDTLQSRFSEIIGSIGSAK